MRHMTSTSVSMGQKVKDPNNQCRGFAVCLNNCHTFLACSNPPGLDHQSAMAGSVDLVAR